MIIEAFPKDDILRVVWWFTGICKDSHNEDSAESNPKTYVLLRRLIDDEVVLDSADFIRVSISVLDACRIGTIWLNGEKTDKYLQEIAYTNASSKIITTEFFNFDFEQSSFAFCDSGLDNETGKYTIPPYVYPLKVSTKKEFDEKINKSKVVCIKSTTGINIYIPSLEVLTSIVCPRDKELRNKLLQKGLDDVIGEYLIDSFDDENGNYHITTKNTKRVKNIVLLSYLARDVEARKRISKSYSYLQISKKFSYDPIMVGIAPYHPKKLQIKVKGIRFNKNCFLVLQVVDCSLPSEKTIYWNNTVYQPESKEFIGHETFGAIRNSKVEKELPITENNPEANAGTVYKNSEILHLIGEPVKVICKTEVVETENHEHKIFLKENEAEGIGTGDESSSSSSKNLAKLRGDDLYQDISNLEFFYQNLLKIVDHQDILAAYCVNEIGMPLLELKTLDFPMRDCSKKLSWAIREGRARKYVLAKIEVAQDRSAYLLEIEKVNGESSSYTLLFNFNM